MHSPVLGVSIKVSRGGCGDLGNRGSVDLGDGGGIGHRGMCNNGGSSIAVGRSNHSSVGHSGQSGDKNNLHKKNSL
jgi:hypothetical protein